MSHPYRDIPDAQRWSRAMAGRDSADVDPVPIPPFLIEADTRVVTAGSCFAQHVARHLREQGQVPFETETAHPLLPEALAESFGYGIYAARYGNIYTSRQLLQLWRRATGDFVPVDDIWEGDGGWFDPFRPTIQPGGFGSVREYHEDRRRHFAAVRRAFGEMDVFVFTLGLTECWASRDDGAVYPLCPGVAAGRFDASRHVLLNLGVDEVVADLGTFIAEVRAVNPCMRVILTVSPVPLAATAEPQHVLVATTYSKAVLRVAAEQLSHLADVYYFPAYEIVTAAGREYFTEDRRSIREQGVRRVMALFSRHVMAAAGRPRVETEGDDSLHRARAMVDALCDEQRLDAPGAATTDSEGSRMPGKSPADDTLLRAETLMQQQRYEEAIECLTAMRRQQSDPGLERLLAICRYQAYLPGVPPSAVADPWAAVPDGRFACSSGLPEVQASELDAATLAAGIRHHGALLVRGLLPTSTAAQLADGVRQALAACTAWHERGEGEFDSSWYARLPLREDCELAQARPWVEGGGGVWLADSPRMLYELTELFEARGITRLIEQYFGERPMLSVGKSTLRCVPGTIRQADWHQDGAFMGADIRSVNVWVALSHCGDDASGLEVLPRRLPRVLPTGSHGAYFDWSVGSGMVAEAAEGMATTSPIFEPGDALLFDHFFLHRTGIPAAIAKDRYAIESWFFAPSAYPAAQVPLRL